MYRLGAPHGAAAAAFPILIALADVAAEFRTGQLESITLVFDAVLLLIGALFVIAMLAANKLARLSLLVVTTALCWVLVIFVFALSLIPSALMGIVAVGATLGEGREMTS